MYSYLRAFFFGLFMCTSAAHASDLKIESITTALWFGTNWIGPDFSYPGEKRGPVMWTSISAALTNGAYFGAYQRTPNNETDAFAGLVVPIGKMKLDLSVTYLSLSGATRSLGDAVVVGSKLWKDFEVGASVISPYARVDYWQLLNGHAAIGTHVGVWVRHNLSDLLSVDTGARVVYGTGVFGKPGINGVVDAGLVFKLDKSFEVTLPAIRYAGKRYTNGPDGDSGGLTFFAKAVKTF
ncbi:MAG: hypothetical protein JWM46_342 [Candidatus Kaiserbacteria bacterium]|nr:hypothetical protein [Candidatus Kaiserbacteria bacterium]